LTCETALRRGASTAVLEALMLQAAQMKKGRHALGEQCGALERQMWQIGG
jgi:hypothetical protein